MPRLRINHRGEQQRRHRNVEQYSGEEFVTVPGHDPNARGEVADGDNREDRREASEYSGHFTDPSAS